MVSDIGGIVANAFSGLTAAKGNTVSKKAEQLAGSADQQKIERSAKEFESILLTSWLQSAEKSFGTVPGGDPESENEDPGKGQFQSYAMQAVATALTKAGGIGIASMIVSHLGKPSVAQQSLAPSKPKSGPNIGLSTEKETM
jgi:Rod binding domain-containing protein